MNTEKFILKARKIHGERFDYSQVEYFTALKKIKIICRKHGVFEQKPSYHLAGKIGCKKCVLGLSNEEAIRRSKAIHKDTYTYSKYEYKGEAKKVIVTCKHHGDFETTAKTHWRGTGCQKCKGLKYLFPEIAKEFNSEKNKGIDIELIGARSHKKVWWKCLKGHEFQARIYHRTNPTKLMGCPICSGRLINETNNLKSRFPEIYKQLHPTKNLHVDIEKLSPGSHIKLWWKCDLGHEYDQSLNSKTSGGYGCPVCAKQRPSDNENLSVNFPDIVKYWDYSKNEKNPDQYRPNSNTKVWWKCAKGHEFQRAISSQAKAKELCPYCAGHLASKENNFAVKYPEIAQEWHPNKNKKGPHDYLPGTQTKVWWQCSKGHEYQAIINSRARGTGCPYCSGRLATHDNNFAIKFPKLVKEWDHKKNIIKPQNCTPKSNKKVWWKCPKGHSYKASLASRAGSENTPGTGCPRCTRASSASEFRILTELRSIFPEVISRHILNKVEADIFIPSLNIGIEYDGEYFHRGKEKKDKEKITFFNENNIDLIRVREKPLKKISELDILVENKKFTKSDMDKIVKVILKLDKKFNSNIHNYLLQDKFVNESLFKQYMNYFPSPIPEKSILRTHPKYCEHWDYKKNYPLTPENFSKGSEYRAWWVCPKGHSYDDTIYGRLSSKGNCPICVGMRISDDNNLEYRFPKIAKEWHPSKNGELMPSQVMPGTHKKVWWLCPEKHSFKIAVYSKVAAGYKKGCQICAGRKKTTKDVVIEAKEIYGDKFDYSELKYIGGKDKFKVICKIHGPFETTYQSFINNAKQKEVVFGCPKCAGRNRTNEDVINDAKAIHGDKYDYSLVNYQGANKKFTIVCKLHGSFEKTYHSHISLKTGCAKCGDQRKKRKPKFSNFEFIELANKIHSKAYDYSKLSYTGVHKKFTVICPEHGEWETNYQSFIKNKKGCKKCFGFEVKGVIYESMSDAARKFGINVKTIDKRLRIGWTVKEAFEIEPRQEVGKYELNGVMYKSISEAARKNGLKPSIVHGRLARGEGKLKAFGLE